MIILPSRNGMLLRNSNGILASDCGGPVEFSCPCTLLTGTNCSCYGTSLTPSTYIADFGEMGKFCLNYVSGCTWQKSVGTITVTLNLTYATNTTRLTVVDGSATVFSGDLVNANCALRYSGRIINTISPSDWDDCIIATQCLNSGCAGKFIKIESNLPFSSMHLCAFTDSGSQVHTLYTVMDFPVYGFLQNCELSKITLNSRQTISYRDSDCAIISPLSTAYSVLSLMYLAGTWRCYVGNYFQGEVIKDLSSMEVGESFVITNEAEESIGTTSTACGSTPDYYRCSAGVASKCTGSYTLPGEITITVY